MFPECRHIMPNGRKCRALALRGKPYCYYHTRLHNYAAAPARAPDEPLKLPIIEDRSAIQLALAQIFDALGSSRLDPRRAGLYLYGLQIGSQNVDRDIDIVPITAVHSMTHTSTGDELAPEALRCPALGDCSTCDHRDTCENFEPEVDDDDEEEDND